MALALYRKYRPQTFTEIVDQQHVKVTLEREIATGKLSHAYLFSGPRGVGKTSLARILAKAVNCETRKEGQGEPCNNCVACQEITTGRSLDVLEIDAASHRGIDTVRETIIETAKFAPSRLKRKVFIIDEVHMLTTEAWNALLKIMEEPPAHVIFVLATTEVHKVPATILSRCQRFDFHRIRPDALVERLKFIATQEKIKVAPAVLQAVARLSEGCVRDAESLLEQLLSLREKEITEESAAVVLPRSSIPAALDLIEAVWVGNPKQGIELINRYLEEGLDLPQLTAETIELLRKVLLIKTGAGEMIKATLETDAYSRLQAFSAQASTEKILHIMEVFLKAKTGLKTAHIPQLPLELAVVEGCGVEGLAASSGSVGSAIQGSSSAPPPILGQKGKIGARAADAPQIASPHRQTPPLAEVKEEEMSALREGSTRASRKLGSPMQLVHDGKEKEISLEEIKNKWPEVLKQAQQENHSLPFLLSTSEPFGVSGSTVQVGVQYAFHRDKLNEVRVRTVLEKILSEQFAMPLHAEAAVYARPAAPQNGVEDILSTLGGRVVE